MQHPEIINGFNEEHLPHIVSTIHTQYWAVNTAPELIEKAIRNSFCFSVLLNGSTIGFARVVSDCARFAWLGDVFILPEHRGKGYSKLLCTHIFSDVRFRSCNWMLGTKDAHGLYAQFGFKPLPEPERFMRKEASAL